MKRLVPVLALAALSVAACKPAAHPQSAAPPAASDASAPSDASNAAASSPAQTDSGAPATPQAPQLAMAYALGLAVPTDQVRSLMESHQEACERAGPDQCQVLGANANAEGDDSASATLTLRATPAWMRMFRTRAEADAKDLGGKISEASTQGDDLSAPIVDTEAAQRARADERSRLTELMRRRTKDLDQTLAVEQQITQVQAEMDQASSELAAMKGRIAMQTLTVSYESTAMVAPRGITAPLAEAGKSFAANFIAMLAFLLVCASYLLPFAGAGALVWVFVRRRRVKPAIQPTGQVS